MVNGEIFPGWGVESSGLSHVVIGEEARLTPAPPHAVVGTRLLSRDEDNAPPLLLFPSRWAAKVVEFLILSSFVGIILPLAAVLIHSFRSICKRNEAIGMRKGAGGARLASDSNKNSSLKIFLVCKSCV